MVEHLDLDPPSAAAAGLQALRAALGAHDEDARIPAALEVAPLGHELEVGVGVLRADHTDRLPGAVSRLPFQVQVSGIEVDVREVVLAELPPPRPSPVDERLAAPSLVPEQSGYRAARRRH